MLSSSLCQSLFYSNIWTNWIGSHCVTLLSCNRTDATTTTLIKWLINYLTDAACVMCHVFQRMFAKTNFPSHSILTRCQWRVQTTFSISVFVSLSCQCVKNSPAWIQLTHKVPSGFVCVSGVFKCISLMHNWKAHVCLTFFPICHVRVRYSSHHFKVLCDLKMCVNF